jgi:hypothetical protein
MNASQIAIAIGILVVSTACNPCQGGPPTTGQGSQWYNPSQWSMPSMPWTTEKPRIKKKSQGVMTDMNQSAKRGWAKTKEVLDPTKMFVADAKPRPSKPAPAKSEPGFWGSLFGSEKPQKEVKTVNDFLNQPLPK